MRAVGAVLLDLAGQQVRRLDQRFLGRLAVWVDVGRQQPVHQQAHAERVLNEQDADEDQGALHRAQGSAAGKVLAGEL